MSGPIVRSGPTPTYSQNWAAAFGEAKPAAKSKSDTGKAKAKPAPKKKAKGKK